MTRKPFISRFYGKEIKPEQPDYWQKVKVEALYWYFDLLERNCSCMDCGDKEKSFINLNRQKSLIKNFEDNTSS